MLTTRSRSYHAAPAVGVLGAPFRGVLCPIADASRRLWEAASMVTEGDEWVSLSEDHPLHPPEK